MIFLKYTFRLGIVLCFSNTCYCQPEFKTSADRIRLGGFEAEEHKVTTRDGYVLTIFRIMSSQTGNVFGAVWKRQHPVLILHGLFISSDSFLLDNDGLGFVLARQNWDVWLGNLRGNYYGREHKRLSPNETEFWNFSYQEMGQKDVTAMIDYILNQTGKSRLNYIGHSLGTTVFFVMASTMPRYNKKINTMFCMAPVAINTSWMLFINNSTLIYQVFHDLVKKFESEEKLEVFPRGKWKGMSKHQISVDGLDEIYFKVALAVLSWVSEVYLGDEIFPDATSLKTLWHYFQGPSSGIFGKYDYLSREKNMEAYRSESPPKYNLSKIKAPIAVYYSIGDVFTSVEDAESTIASLPNVIMKMRIDWMSFTHVDYCSTSFSWNLIMRRKIYESVMNLMQQRDGIL